ncbi:MAG: AAA family ATPase, partial [Acidimicrobiia bacterium]|nr:AAA family ATPase [Acidimicrobiia bacterium]
MNAVLSGPYEPYVPQILLDWPESIRHQQIEGSLVHVDISGFTAMSERLARKGRVGAEEVSAVLNNTFTELLTIASEQGGDLLKFGGDALLLMFTRDGHALRAVRASASMRTRLRTIGKVQTPAGRVDLKMTVGVHSGLIDAFVVGSTHRELIVVGPAATTTVEIEEGAAAGEILLSLDTANYLPAGLLGERKGPGVLLKRTPPPIDYTPPHIFCLEECKVFVPTALRAVVAAPSEGEHRRITVGFIKFIGIDDLLTRLGPEQVAEQLDEMVTLAQEAAEEFGVSFLSTDIDANGGKIIITGGVPTSTGTDEERVLRALRRIADECHGIPLKIGVNQGPAFAGDIGAPFRRTYTVIGDAVNLAARVMSKAEPGQVLATESVLERSETVFDLTELAPFSVKGKTDPVRAWRVGAIEGRKQASSASESPVFGRDGDFEFVRPYLQGTHPVGLIDVCGPSGIGKSRFVRELRADYPERFWGFSDCDQYESSTPYYVFRRLLREVARVGLDVGRRKAARLVMEGLEERAPELLAWFPLLASAMDLPAEETVETAQIDSDFRQAKLQQTVAAFIDAMVDGSGALVIEDAQWADDESRELVIHLAGHSVDRDWAMVMVHRPLDEPFQSDGIVQVDLEPLADSASRQLVEHALPDVPLLEHQLGDLVKRSGGNPLFLLELVAAVRTGQVLPGSLENLVQARIDRLDHVQRKLLRY